MTSDSKEPHRQMGTAGPTWGRPYRWIRCPGVSPGTGDQPSSSPRIDRSRFGAGCSSEGAEVSDEPLRASSCWVK